MIVSHARCNRVCDGVEDTVATQYGQKWRCNNGLRWQCLLKITNDNGPCWHDDTWYKIETEDGAPPIPFGEEAQRNCHDEVWINHRQLQDR